MLLTLLAGLMVSALSTPAERTETTPISRIETVRVQAGAMTADVYRTTTPWIDQIHQIDQWTLRRGDHDILRGHDALTYNAHGMPTMEDAPSGWDVNLSAWGPWNLSERGGNRDIRGDWLLTHDRGLNIDFWTNGISVRRQSPTEIMLSTDGGWRSAFAMKLRSAPPDMARPSLIHVRHRDGTPTGDLEDHEAGLLSRTAWRQAVMGYTDLRTMAGGRINNGPHGPIRFDDYPPMDWSAWSTRGQSRHGVGNPVLARLRLAHEIGAVYHHQFPHLFLEHRGDIDPARMGEWAEKMDPGALAALLNEDELSHVDAFAALVRENRDLVVDGQMRIEVSNEVWNRGNPYWAHRDYFRRRGNDIMAAHGHDWDGVPKEMAALGYVTAQTIARLRRVAPEVEWRGVLGVQTNWSDQDNAKGAPDLPLNQANRSLRGLVTGAEAFFADLRQDEEMAALYAPPPARLGDWFEVHGTTYFSASFRREEGVTLGGIAPDVLRTLAADERRWPELNRMVLAAFITGRADGAAPLQHNRLSDMAYNFRVLAGHADAYGMQTLAYEGGWHGNLGDYWRKNAEREKDVWAWWWQFSHSLELGLMQAAIHDAAVDAGWVGIADFDLFSNVKGWHVFATRQDYRHLSPRYCEYARWMPEDPPVPLGLDADEARPPQERCGRLDDFLAGAKAAGYYVEGELPALDRLVSE